MNTDSRHRHPELRLALEPAQSELVRAFIREASLAESIPPAIASRMADDTAAIWRSLCGQDAERKPIRLSLACGRREVSAKLLLQGHARFANLLPTLAGRIGPGAGLSYREQGVEGWEVALHRHLHERLVAPPVVSDADAPPATDDYRIDLPQESDSPAIARCFLEIYGHHYVHPEVFSPRRYWAKVESGELIPVIARDSSGEIVGHVALEREPDASVAERGEAVVLPAHRGHRLLERMTARLSEEALELGLLGVYAEPVTIHTFSQRNDERDGMPVCAVLLGVTPESVLPKNLPVPTAGQRQSLLLAFRFLRPQAPRSIYAPAPYRDVIVKIYERLGVAAPLADPAAPNGAESQADVKVGAEDDGEIRFGRIGANADIELKQAFRDVSSLGAKCVRLSVPIDDPGVPFLTEAARSLGFFFCGVGPGFAAGGDALLLQYLNEPLDTAKLQLFTDHAKALRDFIDLDRASVGRGA